MPFIPVPGVAQVNLNFLWRGIPTANVLYVSKPLLTAWNTSELAGATGAVKAWWIADLRPSTSNELILQSVKATDLLTETGGTYTDTSSLPAPGSAAVESVPNIAALCVKFTTLARGRGSRGRNYVGGLPATALVDNSWLSATANSVVDSYEGLAEYLSEVDMIHVVVSRYLNNLPRITGQSRPVTAYSYSRLTVATQRNRRD